MGVVNPGIGFKKPRHFVWVDYRNGPIFVINAIQMKKNVCDS